MRKLFPLALYFSAILRLYAQAFSPNIKPEVNLATINTPIMIDANLNESAWQNATRLVNFSEAFPREKTQPPIQVEGWIMQDAQNVYVAFNVQDDPSKIRASLRNRDEIFEDDFVGVLFDTYGAQSWSVFMGVNPRGIQGDTRKSANSQGDDVSFNMLYKSAAKLTETGYQVEMAIPFSNLRYPNGEVQTWRANFVVVHPRETRAQYVWSAIGRESDCSMCQWGFIKDVRVGNAKSTKIEFLPALIGSNSGVRADAMNPNATFKNNPIGLDSFDPSLNLKYNITSGTSVELALNPDFSQIESDQAQIDVNTASALQFPERRPFFQEGADLYNTWIRQVYTRSINNPIAATKFTGRFGQTTVGYIGARDETSPILIPFAEGSTVVTSGKSFSNILRVRKALKGGSSVGTMLTDRRLDGGGSGSTFGVDALIRLNETDQIEAQFVGSQIHEPNNPDLTNNLGTLRFDDNKYSAQFDGESFVGNMNYLSYERNSRKWVFDVDWYSTSPTFRADNGYIQQNDRRRVSMLQALVFYPKDKLVKQISPDIMGGYDWDFTGKRKDVYSWLGFRSQWAGQTQINMRALLFSHEVYKDIDFRNIQRAFINVNSNFSKKLGAGFFVSYGESISRAALKMGIGKDIQAWLSIKPTPQITIDPQISFSQLSNKETKADFFKGYIFRTRMAYQFTRSLSSRIVFQYNDFSKGMSFEPLVTYQVNPFTVFYLGANLGARNADNVKYPDEGLYATNRNVFFKFQYLFRV